MQTARGYMATIASGEVVIDHDRPTGALPGRLLRGARTIPEPAVRVGTDLETIDAKTSR